MDATRARRRAISWRARLSNLVGAVLAFVYFRFIDPIASGPEFTWREIVFGVVVFTVLTVAGARLSSRWAAPMFGADRRARDAQRRALLFPWVTAGVTFLNWMIAGVLFGVVGPLLAGWPLTIHTALRAIIGITIVGGVVTSAIVFFSVESRWRQELPAFFPSGDLSAVPGVPRVPVRARLLTVFILTSIGPLILLVIVAWRRGALAAADPTAAAGIFGEMVAIIVFLTVAGLVAAVRLSWVVSDSVATPLVGLTFAMARVERGDLDAQCPVVSNDEIGAATEGFNRMLDGLRERETIKETFGRYVSREVRDEILAGRVSV